MEQQKYVVIGLDTEGCPQLMYEEETLAFMYDNPNLALNAASEYLKVCPHWKFLILTSTNMLEASRKDQQVPIFSAPEMIQ